MFTREFRAGFKEARCSENVFYDLVTGLLVKLVSLQF